MAKNQQLVEQKPGGAVVTKMDEDLAALVAGDTGMGKENLTAKDMAIPRLAVLQPLSPQVTPGKSEYLDAAKPGMIYDNVLNKLYSGEKGITVVPVSFRSTYIEWVTRAQGGGFVADHGPDESILQKCTLNKETGQQLTAEGHEIVLTAEYFSFILAEEGVFPIIISMAKTQHRKARVWNTMINQYEIQNPVNPEQRINPAMFYRTYHLRTALETNDKGSWFGWKIEGAEEVLKLTGGRDLYMRARKFHADIAAGAVKVAPPVEQQPVEDENSPM